MKIHDIRSELWLPRPLDEVFEFFSDAANLELLTPPFLNFRILTPFPLEMKVGTLIDYQIRLHGLPVKWRTEITAWEPGKRFVDEQLRGPFRLWRHEHTFEASEGGTLTRDHVQYAVPLDFIAHPLFVKPDVERIFAYRQEKMGEFFRREDSAVPV